LGLPRCAPVSSNESRQMGHASPPAASTSSSVAMNNERDISTLAATAASLMSSARWGSVTLVPRLEGAKRFATSATRSCSACTEFGGSVSSLAGMSRPGGWTARVKSPWTVKDSAPAGRMSCRVSCPETWADAAFNNTSLFFLNLMSLLGALPENPKGSKPSSIHLIFQARENKLRFCLLILS